MSIVFNRWFFREWPSRTPAHLRSGPPSPDPGRCPSGLDDPLEGAGPVSEYVRAAPPPPPRSVSRLAHRALGPHPGICPGGPEAPTLGGHQTWCPPGGQTVPRRRPSGSDHLPGEGKRAPPRNTSERPRSPPQPGALSPSPGRSNHPDVDGRGPGTRDQQSAGRRALTWEYVPAAPPRLSGTLPSGSQGQRFRPEKDGPPPWCSERQLPGRRSPASEYVRAASTPPYFRHTVALVSGTAMITRKRATRPPGFRDDSYRSFGPRLEMSPSGPVALLVPPQTAEHRPLTCRPPSGWSTTPRAIWEHPQVSRTGSRPPPNGAVPPCVCSRGRHPLPTIGES